MSFNVKKIAVKLPKSDKPEDLLKYFTILSEDNTPSSQNIYDILRNALIKNELENLTAEQLAEGIALFANISPVETADILEGKLIDNKDVAATLFDGDPDINDITRIKLIAELYKLLETKTGKTPLDEKIETIVLAMRENRTKGENELAKIPAEELMEMFNAIYSNNKILDNIFKDLSEKTEFLIIINRLIEKHSYHLHPKKH